MYRSSKQQVRLLLDVFDGGTVTENYKEVYLMLLHVYTHACIVYTCIVYTYIHMFTVLLYFV